MPDVWEFTPPVDRATTLEDGTVLVRRSWGVLLNGTRVGEVDVHLHRRRGPDGVTDLSYGMTTVAFGPLIPAGR